MTASPKTLRVGTRGSELALAQATLFEAAVQAAFPEMAIERVVIRTIGDQRPDIRLAELSGASGSPVDKGIFTKELEIALREERIDVAVHSLKDVPTEIDPVFSIAGAMERAPVEDVLLSLSPCPGGLDDLPRDVVVATSSVRRKCQLLAARPDLGVLEIRGNVPTRMRKVLAGDHGHALLLARAGLQRLGWRPEDGIVEIDGQSLHAAILSEESLMPAAGQGAIGLEIRRDDKAAREVVAALTHPATWARVSCERAFLFLLQAGCHTPVGITTAVDKDGQLHARAVVFDPDGHLPCRRGEAVGPANDPDAVAAALFASLA